MSAFKLSSASPHVTKLDGGSAAFHLVYHNVIPDANPVSLLPTKETPDSVQVKAVNQDEVLKMFPNAKVDPPRFCNDTNHVSTDSWWPVARWDRIY